MQRPHWLVLPAPKERDVEYIQTLLGKGRLHSVCESAQCPNIGECFGNRTCTFMILGDVCTRNCAFCAVKHGKPQEPDPNEPNMIGQTVYQLGLRHVVVTSVTRDDLPDGGASQFAATIRTVRQKNPDTTIEVLIPDFRGAKVPLHQVIAAAPDVINHNLETVPRLYPTVRPGANYTQSLQLIKSVSSVDSKPEIVTKSGLMLGLGETLEEITCVMQDLVNAGCQILTLGQYLCPSPLHHPLAAYIHPDIFEQLAKTGDKLGFKQVIAGPLVRSSYHAADSFAAVQQQRIV